MNRRGKTIVNKQGVLLEVWMSIVLFEILFEPLTYKEKMANYKKQIYF